MEELLSKNNTGEKERKKRRYILVEKTNDAVMEEDGQKMERGGERG